MENAKRACSMKKMLERQSKKGDMEKMDKEGEGRGVMGRLKRGIQALCKIRKYQSGAELLI